MQGSQAAPLHKLRLADHYDNIVIGAGIGGLTCAASLALCGEGVLVLEKHYAVGGIAHSFRRGGFEFNVGMHYLGQVGYEGHPLNTIYDWISGGRLKWHYCGDQYERFLIGPEQDDYVAQAGIKTFVEDLSKHFPADRQAISEYVDMVRDCESSAPLFFFEKALSGIGAVTCGSLLRAKFLHYARSTTYDSLRRFISNEKLISVLCANWNEIGVPPTSSSFAGHAIGRANTLGGTYFPIGGTAGVASQIVPTISQCGGTVAVSAPVRRIMIKDNCAQGVELENGTVIRAKRVISAAGLKSTFNNLIAAEHLTRLPFYKEAMEMPSTSSMAGVYLGLNGTAEELGLSPAPLVTWRSYDFDSILKETENIELDKLIFPYDYMISLSARDPQWKERYPGKSTMIVGSQYPLSAFSKWQGSRHKRRPKDYEEYKERMKEYFVARACEFYPKIRGRIELTEAYTPLTAQHFCNHPSGEIYGLCQTPQRFEYKWLKPRMPIKNLFLTGVDISVSSTVGALLGGALTTVNILGPIRTQKLLRKMLPWKFSRRDSKYFS